MKKQRFIMLIGAITIIFGTFTACGKTDTPIGSHPTETTPPKNQLHQNFQNDIDTQNEVDFFMGPYYGTIKKVDNKSIEIELLTLEDDPEHDEGSEQSTNSDASQKLEQQATKLEEAITFQNSGETLTATFAPSFQISNAGKTVLDLKEGDMIAFYTNSSSNKEIVSIHIMG